MAGVVEQAPCVDRMPTTRMNFMSHGVPRMPRLEQSYHSLSSQPSEQLARVATCTLHSRACCVCAVTTWQVVPASPTPSPSSSHVPLPHRPPPVSFPQTRATHQAGRARRRSHRQRSCCRRESRRSGPHLPRLRPQSADEMKCDEIRQDEMAGQWARYPNNQQSSTVSSHPYAFN